MENQDNIIRISVRSLVEFLLRSGSLSTQTGPSSEAAMLEGARIHRALQKKAGDGYRAEVPLRMDVPAGGAVLRLEGRADGIFFMKDSDEKAEASSAGGVRITGSRADKNGREASSAGGVRITGSRADKNGREASSAGGVRITGSRADRNCQEDSSAGGLWTVDEIKTVFRGLASMEGPEEVHLAQARCYAFMYAQQEGLDRMKIRMTYCSQVTGDVRYFYEVMSFEALEKWFTELVGAYEPWIRLRLDFEESKGRTVREMVFPFPYREGQYELAAGVYRTIVHEKKLFLQAPTGTGKTMAVLFPALKALGTGKADRIFYLTAKGVTGAVAQEALSLLYRKGLSVRSLTLISRERACPCGQADCRPEVCARADGHFDRINTALEELLQEAAQGAPMTARAVADCACRHNVCPYYLSLDAAEFADVVICDYNYVFHPQARLERFFEGRNRSILLIDEAHNLVERGRDLYSAQISYRQVRQFRKSVKTVWPRLWKKMKGLVHVLRVLEQDAASEDRKIRVLRDWAPEQAELCHVAEEVRDQIQWILEQENRSAALYGSLQQADGDSRLPQASPKTAPEEETGGNGGNSGMAALQKGGAAGMPELLEFYFNLSHFSEVLRELDEHYIVYTERGGQGGFSLHLFCADPSGRLGACMDGLTSAIFFSATFLPIQYYKGLLGGKPEDFEMYARSSFSPANRKVVIVRDVTSRYRDRNEENYARIARSIGRVVSCRPGNYMVYFPSYAFLENVLDAFCRICRVTLPAEEPVQIRQEPLLSEDPLQIRREPLLSEDPLQIRQEPLLSEDPLQIRWESAAEMRGWEASGDSEASEEMFVLVQRREMTDAERAAFLQAFEDPGADCRLIGFCVLGGMFGEGIDLRSDRLIGSLIVGTGLPPVEPQRELLQEYFSGQGRNGYDFAYRFPGMNKVLQAAGRVIRTAEDVGIVVLMDGRFSESANRELFPLEWGQPEAVGSEEAAERIRRFWKESK